MLYVAKLLLTNKQGGSLAQMTVIPGLSAEDKTIGAIVMHTVTVLSANVEHPFLLPFLHKMTNPKALAVRMLHMYIHNVFCEYVCSLNTRILTCQLCQKMTYKR